MIEELLNHVDVRDNQAVALVYELHGKTRGEYNVRQIIKEIRERDFKEVFSEDSDKKPSQTEAVDATRDEEKSGSIFQLTKVEAAGCIVSFFAIAACAWYLHNMVKWSIIPIMSCILSAVIGIYAGGAVYRKRGKIRAYFDRKPKPIETEGSLFRMEAEAANTEDQLTASVEEVIYGEMYGTGEHEEILKTELRLFGSSDTDMITVRYSPFLIGTQENAADGVIMCPEVSGIHAKIEKIAGSYFLEDMDSKNGTYCNGIRIEPKEKFRLVQGDRILFACEEYCVSLI